MDIDPIIRPVDRFRIPLHAFEVFSREQPRSLADISSFENETIVKHERQELIEGHFLLPDLAARISQTLEIRPYFFGAQQCFA